MRYQATVKEIPEYTVYYKRGVVPSYQDLGAFIVGSAEECRAANPDLRCVEPDYCFVTYLDPEHKERDIRIEYAQAVKRAGVPVGDIGFRVLPAAKVVSVVHKGPYEDLGEAYAFALQWLSDNGLKPADNIREQYIDGVWNRDDPNQYLTEIQIPVEA